MRSIEIPQPDERDWRYRALEILPGALTYIILALPILLGRYAPRLSAYFIVAYILLWFVRAIGLNIRSVQGWRTMNQHKNLPWAKLNQDLEGLSASSAGLPRWHAHNVARVQKYMPADRIKPSEVYHAVFIAFYNESRDIVEPTIQSVIDSHYDLKKVILILAYEERGGPQVESMANDLIREFGSKFYYAQAIKHPDGLAGEIIGKGGNITYAGRHFQKYLEEQKIDPLRVLVTTLDADNHPDKQYFAALTYTYCSTEDPKHSSYQPIPMYLNNIWDAPAPMRVIATGNSFWNLVLSLRPHMLRNFSAHAQPMAALIDTDFWSVRTIVEDGHQFWRTWFRYDGNHIVFPIYVPIYQDAVLAETYRRTLRIQFKQVQRWAWGASDVAFVAYKGFLTKNNIPKHKLIAKFGRLLEGHVSWSTAPLILLLAVYPTFLFHTNSFLSNELPQYASNMQRAAMVGILITIYICFRTLPPKPARYKHHRTFFMVIQWAYLPLTSIVFSAFAAINAQTRLMFGKYLGFNVTEKVVKK